MVIKAQALADFIVEFTHDVTLEPEVVLPEHDCRARLVLQTPSGEQKKYTICIGFKATNNEAEYEALLARPRVATELGVESLDVFSDSQLVEYQVQGNYLAKDIRMVAYLDKVKNKSMKIKYFKIRQIPKEENKKADALANLASAFDFISDKSILLEFFPNPSIKIAKTIYQAEADPTWMDDIIAYLLQHVSDSSSMRPSSTHCL
ncbi:hypothetical protein Acr_07g0010140 [Actinidia rufa]|uniref:RNase H type-1 domain-containing protein n=1 Tax=Actinidia rufa TaxID=165716 RepID=A0A7J0EYV7_9ERIC|nr:hypothetical protein Acr_07g0010140 [Actinidia rufa]